MNENMPTVMAVGDIMLGDSPACPGHGTGSKIKKYGPGFPFLYVKDVLADGDLVIGNLEAVLSGNSVNKNKLKSHQFRCHPEAARGLNRAGFNVITLANNHCYDHGQKALLETILALNANHIDVAGEGKTVFGAKKPLYKIIKGIKIALFSFCIVPGQIGGNPVCNPGDIQLALKECEGDCHFKVVSIHWGDEYIGRPSPGQIELGRRIIDSGANLVIGHHPHVIQGIEEYNKGIIAYSLGNFVSDMELPNTKQSMILKVGIDKAGINSWEALPVKINKNFQPFLGVDRCNNSFILDNYRNPNYRRSYNFELAFLRQRARVLQKCNFARNLFRIHPKYSWSLMGGYLSRKLRLFS